MRIVSSFLSFVAGGLLLVSLGSACSSSSDGGGGGGGCSEAAGDLCNKINSCFPVLISLVYGDVATCVSRTELGCNEELGAPGSNVGGAEIATCGNAIAALSCDQVLVDSPQECNVAGSRKDGEACQLDAQCESTNCRITSGSCGTCAARSPAGGACASSDDCAENLVCSSTVCATPVDAGGACSTDEQCAGALICKGGACAQASGAGEACNPQASECDGLQALFCNPQSSTCQKVEFANAGEPCGFVDSALVACTGGGKCNAPAGAQQGTCSAPLADGASCSLETGPDCLAPAECVAGSCQLPNPESCG